MTARAVAHFSVVLRDWRVRRALRKRYGRKGYRFEPDGRVMVRVHVAGRPESEWMPFGDLSTPERAAHFYSHPMFQ